MTNSPGAGVDSEGRAVLDPTRNVLDLVEAAVKRLDDLREAETRHIREITSLRSDYIMELRKAESERIDAIRSVDITTVQRAAEVQAEQASALAAQVVATADAFRAALAAALEPLQKDIADLRRAQYEQQGSKTAGVDIRSVMFAVVGFLVAAVAVVVAVVK